MESNYNLLSYTPASRLGDDMIIWSWLTDLEKPIYNALDFRKSQVSKRVLTKFLRLRNKGFSWAPASPYAAHRSNNAQSSRDFHRAFDSIGTEWGEIS
jgi:hypothetical protein